MTEGRRKAPRTQATLSKSVDRCLLKAPGKPALELEAGNRRSQAKGALDVVDCKPIRGWDPRPLTGTVDSRTPAVAAAARQSMPPRPCSKGSFGRCSAKAAKLPPLAGDAPTFQSLDLDPFFIPPFGRSWVRPAAIVTFPSIAHSGRTIATAFPLVSSPPTTSILSLLVSSRHLEARSPAPATPSV